MKASIFSATALLAALSVISSGLAAPAPNPDSAVVNTNVADPVVPVVLYIVADYDESAEGTASKAKRDVLNQLQKKDGLAKLLARAQV